MRPVWKIRSTAALATFALLVAACGQTGKSSAGSTAPTGAPSAGPVSSPAQNSGGSTISGGGGGGTGTGGSTSGGTSTGGTSTGGGSQTTDPAKPNEKKAAKRSERIENQLPDVHLFSEKENTIGITKDQITMCTHGALVLADAFDTKVQDLNIFWDWLNAHGGVYGRKVVMNYTDDKYTASTAVQAAEQCKAMNPFIMFGGIGFDQIPPVREWAEQNHQLYIHHIAREDLDKKYSFSYQPTVEQAGALGAQWIIKAHRTQRIGIVYRNSENWEPGHRTFKEAVDKAGVNVVADLPVNQNQGVYTAQIQELQAQDAEVVFLWENALAADEIIAQAKNQGYNPIWFIFAFNQTTDTLDEQALNPPLEGLTTWTPYSPGMTGGPYSSYSDTLNEFNAELKKYGSGSKGNDILWTTWMAWKQIYQLLLDCGPDCTRNQIVALLISGFEKTVSTTAGCPFDFSRNGHVSGTFGDVVQTFRRPQGSSEPVGWRPISGGHCALKVPPTRAPIKV